MSDQGSQLPVMVVWPAVLCTPRVTFAFVATVIFRIIERRTQYTNEQQQPKIIKTISYSSMNP